MYRNLQEAVTAWQAHAPMFAERGAVMPGVVGYIPEPFRANYTLAMDAAQPQLFTPPSAGIPAFLTTLVDPTVFRILFAPSRAAQIFGEVKKGTWLDQTAMFQVVEHTGEVSSYGDYAENGSVGANTAWPQRQAYLFQTIKEYGELELERAGLARLNWVSELDQAAATVMSKFQNLSYFFGITGIQNYGLLNDPSLSASLTPSIKAAGGVKWVTNGVVTATANEIYTDIQSLFSQLVIQTAGLVDQNTPMVLALSPGASVGLTATNSFNVNVTDLLKKNFPNITIETAVQYGVTSTSNPQGIAGGNLVMLLAKSIEGQDTGYMAFNEKMRAHALIKQTSSFKQKMTGGTWGAIIRMPVAVATMLGV